MNPKGTLERLWMLGWIELYVSFLVCSEQNDGACWFLENIKSEIPAESAVLRDAFFKYQTKPKLTTHGDLYHEGKGFEVKLREMKPAMLSQELKEALGMPEGARPPAHQYAEIWSTSFLSTLENSWAECSNSSWS